MGGVNSPLRLIFGLDRIKLPSISRDGNVEFVRGTFKAIYTYILSPLPLDSFLLTHPHSFQRQPSPHLTSPDFNLKSRANMTSLPLILQPPGAGASPGNGPQIFQPPNADEGPGNTSRILQSPGAAASPNNTSPILQPLGAGASRGPPSLILQPLVANEGPDNTSQSLQPPGTAISLDPSSSSSDQSAIASASSDDARQILLPNGSNFAPLEPPVQAVADDVRSSDESAGIHSSTSSVLGKCLLLFLHTYTHRYPV